MTHEPPVACWAKELCDGLKFVQPDLDWEGHMRQLLPIDHRQAARDAKSAFCQSIQQFASDPTADDCPDGRRRCTYAQSMLLGGIAHTHAELPVPAFLTADAPLIKKRALARLRLGAAPISANQEHSKDSRYSERICKRCSAQQVDNEQHLLFECSVFSHIRHKFAAVLEGHHDLAGLMKGVYDTSTVDGVMDYVLEVLQCLGHRQGTMPDIAG
jgi:hypothetical protein